MIIYGYSTKSSVLKQTHHRCPNCNDFNLNVVKYTKVADLFWIPVFPLSSQYLLTCKGCEACYELPSFNMSQIDVKTSHSPWYFIGLIILSIAIPSVMITGNAIDKQHHQLTEQYRKNPQIGDIIIVKTNADPNYPFEMAKIIRLNDTAMTIVVSTHLYKDLYSANSRVAILTDADFHPKEFTLNIENFLKNSDIQRIYRPRYHP